MILNCPNCAAPFVTYPSHQRRCPKRGVYCSAKCYREYQAATVHNRFWAHVNKTETCWLWTGSKSPTGYGLFRANSTSVRAHRWIYEEKHGKLARDLRVCHACDQRACVRDEHLFAATDKENLQDAKRKGRLMRGERHWKTTLTEEDVRTIRREKTAGTGGNASLSRRYKVSRNTIMRICSRLSWQHVE